MARIYRQSLRHNGAPQSRVSAQPSPLLASSEGTYAKMAAISQVLMLILVGFGYWYTVLPVYQKSLLDEEIAKKTIELNATAKELTDLKTGVRAKEAELASLQHSIDGYRSESRKARIDAVKAQTESVIAQSDAAAKYASLRMQSLGLFWGELLRECTGEDLSTETKLADCVESQAKRSGAFQQLTTSDRSAVLQKVNASIVHSRDDWNQIATDYNNDRRALEAKKAEQVKAYEAEKSARKVLTAQDKMDALGTDYRHESGIRETTSAIIMRQYAVSTAHRKVLQKILNIPV